MKSFLRYPVLNIVEMYYLITRIEHANKRNFDRQARTVVKKYYLIIMRCFKASVAKNTKKCDYNNSISFSGCGFRWELPQLLYKTLSEFCSKLICDFRGHTFSLPCLSKSRDLDGSLRTLEGLSKTIKKLSRHRCSTTEPPNFRTERRFANNLAAIFGVETHKNLN